MKQFSSKYIITIVIYIICLIIGTLIGIIYQSKYNIEIDNKIRYSELLNWFTTIIIGILVGYVLKNQFENNKVVKGYLLDDLKKISADIIILKECCYEKKGNRCFTEDQRKEINAKINILDKTIKVFSDFLKECYKEKHQIISDSLVTSYINFNRKVTGDEFYSLDIGNSYFDDIVNESSKFESELRRLTLMIIKEL